MIFKLLIRWKYQAYKVKRKSRFKIIYKNRNKIILHGYFRSKNRMMIGRKKINMIQIPTMMSNHYWLFQKVNSTNKDLKSEAFVFDYHRSFLFHSLFLRLLPLFPCLVIHELSNYLISFIIKSSFSFYYHLRKVGTTATTFLLQSNDMIFNVNNSRFTSLIY